MVIGEFKISLYGKFIVLALIFNMIFNYWYLRKEKISKQLIWLSILMVSIFCIVGAKIMTLLTTNVTSLTLFNAGLSSYGGAIGIIAGSFIFSKLSNEVKVIKSNILSLPLMYSIAKLGCFFSGCCYGIPYNGLFSVTYLNGLNIPLFPIQLVETITFLVVFILGIKKYRNNIEVLIILCAIFKFVLDYFRYSHLKQILSINQIISLLIIFICLILLIVRCLKKKKC